ncbi:hypothetical protein CEXT_395971 [Caerostris extrusa]|uniref:Uncharacterized protein n=1 Tax=Caerostris extrusa TaxID=172846 RepID=A0AAV4U2U7_CAEEX|nr:hypothetical protein CEXT_395971 [Caerostris extrusa]
MNLSTKIPMQRGRKVRIKMAFPLTYGCTITITLICWPSGYGGWVRTFFNPDTEPLQKVQPVGISEGRRVFTSMTHFSSQERESQSFFTYHTNHKESRESLFVTDKGCHKPETAKSVKYSQRMLWFKKRVNQCLPKGWPKNFFFSQDKKGEKILLKLEP